MLCNYRMNRDTLKTMLQGAFGGLSFGVYHQFTTNQMMDLNNEKQNLLHKYLMDKHQNEIDELKGRINKLNNIFNVYSKN